MNWSKFFIAFIAAFVLIFFFGFLWHGILMKSAYMEIASHYRAHDEMVWPAMLLGHALMAFFFTCVYARFVAAGGPGAGMKLGIKIGLIFVGLHFIRFAVEPLTMKILVLGGIGDILEIGLMGALVGMIYKPSSAAV